MIWWFELWTQYPGSVVPLAMFSIFTHPEPSILCGEKDCPFHTWLYRNNFRRFPPPCWLLQSFCPFLVQPFLGRLPIWTPRTSMKWLRHSVSSHDSLPHPWCLVPRCPPLVLHRHISTCRWSHRAKRHTAWHLCLLCGGRFPWKLGSSVCCCRGICSTWIWLQDHWLDILCQGGHHNLRILLFLGQGCSLGGIWTRVGHAHVSADAHQIRIDAHWCASSAYWTKRIFPLLTHKLPFWIHFSKSLGSEPQLTNINYEEYVEVSSFCVNEAREFIRVFAMFDSSRLQITSDRNIISLNKSPDILWQRTSVVSSPKLFPMQCINPIFASRIVILNSWPCCLCP